MLLTPLVISAWNLDLELSSVFSFNISPIKKPEIAKKNQIIKFLLKCFLAIRIRMIEIGNAINAVLD